ncbi:MAG: hypothetical protein LBF22_03950 [Deltaproteobacteria bacterium]|nr:hypothetical protein [Deltaproteobacteria bacterium]
MTIIFTGRYHYYSRDLDAAPLVPRYFDLPDISVLQFLGGSPPTSFFFEACGSVLSHCD